MGKRRELIPDKRRGLIADARKDGCTVSTDGLVVLIANRVNRRALLGLAAPGMDRRHRLIDEHGALAGMVTRYDAVRKWLGIPETGPRVLADLDVVTMEIGERMGCQAKARPPHWIEVLPPVGEPYVLSLAEAQAMLLGKSALNAGRKGVARAGLRTPLSTIWPHEERERLRVDVWVPRSMARAYDAAGGRDWLMAELARRVTRYNRKREMVRTARKAGE